MKMLIYLFRRCQQYKESTTTLEINNAKLYVPVVILSINDNIKFNAGI